MNKRHDWRTRDPHHAREKGRYEHPIPSREFLLQRLDELGCPARLDDLVADLQLEPQDVGPVERRLQAMEREGQVVRNRRGAWCVVRQGELTRGRVMGHPDGFGFLIPDHGGEDLFLSPREMRALFHGDRVLCRIAGQDRRGRLEGAVVEILERAHQQLVGRYRTERGIGFVVPDHKRIRHEVLIPPASAGGAADGQIVVVEIVEQPTRRSPPVGRIAEVLGDHMAPGMEIDIAIRSHDLPHEWPEAVLAEAERLRPEVQEPDKRNRLDLRDTPLVTIDGADARDFDDAVYAERRGKGWRLLVAIADVSHYVPVGTALDAEAYVRGTSVYFPGQVIPMLPEHLSNGLCSINPDVDRLCMVCEMQVAPDGSVTRARFHEGVMRSHARLTYDTVADILSNPESPARRTHAALVPQLEELHALYRVLAGARAERGAIDFDTQETRIVFGADRKIERIEPVQRNDAHRLIEECMIAANVAAAKFLRRHKIPALYRVHDGPTAEKLADLREFLGELGLKLMGGERPDARHYAALLGRIHERPDAHLIQTVLLRSLAQAVYTPENAGHFGLALECYAHFTSPIRRYPDLLVHRAIRHVLRGGSATDFAYGNAQMITAGDHCSMTERRADEATRDAVAWLKCEYMADRIGEEFDGVISAATSFGVFVELAQVYIDGLVHVTALPNDYYHFDPAQHRLVGERTRRIFRLGDRIRVRVVRVDLDERKIDLEPVIDAAAAPQAPVANEGRKGKDRSRSRGKGKKR